MGSFCRKISYELVADRLVDFWTTNSSLCNQMLRKVLGTYMSLYQILVPIIYSTRV
jgi:hypothetical protein